MLMTMMVMISLTVMMMMTPMMMQIMIDAMMMTTCARGGPCGLKICDTVARVFVLAKTFPDCLKYEEGVENKDEKKVDNNDEKINEEDLV